MFVETQRIVYEKEQNKREKAMPTEQTYKNDVNRFWHLLLAHKDEKTSKKNVDYFDVKTIIYTFARRKEETLFRRKAR